MDLSLIVAVAEHAAEQAERSEVPFFIAGGLLATFAVVVSVIGFKRPDFPTGEGAARGVMALGIALVIGAMSMAVYVSG